MSMQQQQNNVTQQNLAMVVAGFLIGGTIVAAGVGGFALGRHIAPAAVVTAPVTTTNTASLPATSPAIALIVRSDAAKPGVYHFSPAAITLHVGRKATLNISNPGTALHGISIPVFGVTTMIQPAHGAQASSTQVAFTPTKPGSYTAYCIVYCGPGHAEMILHVTVLA